MPNVERYQGNEVKGAVCLSLEVFTSVWLRILLSLNKKGYHWAVGTTTVPSNRRQPITYGSGV